VRGHHDFHLLQATEKLPPPELSFSFKELWFKTAPPNFLLSSLKGCSPPLFLRPACGAPPFAYPELQFLCYSE